MIVQAQRLRCTPTPLSNITCLVIPVHMQLVFWIKVAAVSQKMTFIHWILVSIVAVGRTSRNYPQVPVGTFRVSSLKAFLASVSFCGHTGCVRNALFFTCRASTLRTIGFMLSAGKRVEFSLKKRPGPDLGIRLRSSMERVGWGFKEWYGRHKGCRTRGFAWKLFKFAGLVSRRVSYKIYVLIFFTPNTLQGTSN